MSYCRECGHQLTNEHEFCPECGHPVERKAASSQGEQSQRYVESASPSREEGRDSVKPSNKKTKVITISVIAAAAILGGAYYGIDKTMMAPRAVSEKFIASVKGNDVDKVKQYVNDGQIQLEANDEQTKSFITYLHENPDVMKSISEGLAADSRALEAGVSSEDHSSYAKLEQDGKKWGIFDHYTVQVNPVYAKVQSTEDATAVYIDGKKAGTVSSDSSKKIGPFLPGTHTVKGEVQNDYGKVENEQEIEAANGEDVNMEFDWSDHAVYVSSDYDDATLFVNGKDTKTEIGDIDYLGPLPMDGSVKVYAKRKFDSGEKKTEEVSIKKGIEDITLNFDEENTAEASAPSKEEQSDDQDSKADSGVSTSEVSSFIEQYMDATISSINSGDFSIAEPYIDSNGPKYKEQKEYTAYLIKKGITEDLLSFNVNRVTKIDDSMYKVYTTEEYDISYGDGSVKYKKFNSIHKVKELSDGSLGVYQLISSTEVK
ncbi:zinc ribbon domain-containing protein [Priestia megaterium]|uniref:zinc ribbon domain-containing protein n=1 Tax=Priestia megaterium TaxID=1404 RepID=UPI0013E342A3|nr:zinc-ribbon domain-containing protein [Priestia megaterium]MED3865154.1 zinc ribbon domain-containing protein [Priestia megaterium]MED4100503.1 zinc ribbon domain-containing protein [Priestia megaterium]MED4144446.1 zinc ribbon domain-containing protein [Priestia megaterium]MED4165745.1 zinc ribbon domain-containing protein [Priestia megaterium]MED4198109.1 zinc ribbon domain-containing protein [Priestia megaterium]